MSGVFASSLCSVSKVSGLRQDSTPSVNKKTRGKWSATKAPKGKGKLKRKVSDPCQLVISQRCHHLSRRLLATDDVHCHTDSSGHRSRNCDRRVELSPPLRLGNATLCLLLILSLL